MKKFLPYILILIILASGSFTVSTKEVHAAGVCYKPADSFGPRRDAGLTEDQCKLNPGFEWVENGVTTVITAPPASTSGEDKSSCGLTNFFTAKCIADAIGNLAYNTILKIAAFVLYLAGNILDFVLKYTVVDMAERLEGMTGINIAWRLIRDLMNIAFIFMLVYEGIKMIIGQSSTAKAKTFITGIVLASLLINFSLFFTKVMIDASNIVTIGLYNSIIANSATTAPVGSPATSVGLSSPFMTALGMTDFYSNATFSKVQENAGDGNLLTLALMGTVLFVIVAFVFLAVACMFVIRYITLLVLLMLSPLAYMGMALPFTKKYATEWWSSLTGQLIFAPVYMLMTLVVLTLMTSPGFIVKGGWGSVVGGVGSSAGGSTASGMGLLFNFVVIIGLAIASLTTAKKTASQGNAMIGKATGKLSAFAGGALMGGAARFSRATLGRGGANWANDEDLKRRAAEGDRGARMKLAMGNRMAGASFDVRASRVGKAATGTLGVDFGKVDPKKANYKSELEEQRKKAAEKAKMYEPGEVAKEKAKATKDQDEAEKKRLKEEAEAKKGEAEKATKDHDKVSAEVEKNEKELAALEKRLGEAVTDAQKSELQGEIDKLKNDPELQRRKESLASLKSLMTEKISAQEAAEKAHKDHRTAEEQLNEDYKNRLKAVADRTGHQGEHDTRGNTILRWVANTAGTVAYAAGAGSMPKTKSERESIARKIRGLSKEKSRAERIAELAIEEQKEKDAKKKEDEGVGEDKKEDKKDDAKPSSEKPEGEPKP